MRIISFLLFALLFGCSYSGAQSEKDILDSLYEEIEFLVGEDWYLKPTENGFTLTFCRTCTRNYHEYLDNNQWPYRKFREDFYSSSDIDSVSYYTLVSNYHNLSNLTREEKIEYFTSFYKPESILQLEVIFSEKWTTKKIASVQANNDLLKEEILKEPLYKTSKKIFSDYRYWIPEKYLQKRTEAFDFYFERLPYKSITIDKSIFIIHNTPSFFSEPLLVDKSDPEYFWNRNNELKSEKERTLKIIALALGIHDFEIIN